MLRGYVIGFSKPDKETRYGDAELFRDGKYNLLIDGYCGEGSSKLISYLKKRKIKDLYLVLSHAHYDHYYGLRQIIRDSYFNIKRFYCYDPNTLKSGLSNNSGSNEVRKDINAFESLISEIKNKKNALYYYFHKLSYTPYI